MDHPSKQFCYIIVNTQKPVSSIDKALPPSTSHSESTKSKRTLTYKCYTCHYVSSMFWPMVKHMQRHFMTYVCTECDSLYPSAFGIRSHIFNKHPGCETKPLVLKGSEKDIENAKRNIVVVTESGKKRKITEDELAQAEKEEEMSDQSLEMYAYDEPIEVKTSSPVVKETARKSTGSPKRHSVSPQQTDSKQLSPQQLQRLQNKHKRALHKARRKHLCLNNIFVSFTSRGKNIKLPVETLQKLVNFDVKLSLEQDIKQQT